ncbi:4-alpha-glucanotransferase [Streptococcus rifensis]
MEKRYSGILMHISSLANRFGIGSFGQSAYDFVDFLDRTEQKFWQVLPLGPLSYGDSPYQSFSAFAGNTYFIDLERLIEERLIDWEDLNGLDFGNQNDTVDYTKIFETRRPILEKVVQAFKENGNQEAYQHFLADNMEWIYDFADYMAIKEYFDNKSWIDWPDEGIRRRDFGSLAYYRELLADQIMYHRTTQYLFFQQWQDLKAYANHKGIEIIGDMPIYVSADSSDMWTSPHYFKTDEAGRPTVVAGCPPDAFSDTGQLWGNPIYDWNAMASDGFQWWVLRMKKSLELYDWIRIDHFRGFEAYWEVPAEDDTALNGRWVKGPDKLLFDAFKEGLGENLPIIAEDLGLITDEVIELRDHLGLPGMKVLQFAYDSLGDSIYLPHRCDYNTVTYTGTHDNNTIRGWYEEDITEATRVFFDQYSHRKTDETPSQAMIRQAWATNSQIAITSMQDLLDLDSKSRMNTPSTLGINWQWRMGSAIIDDMVEDYLLNLTKLYSRERTHQVPTQESHLLGD